MALGLIEWGRREYGAALDQMRALRLARRRGEIPDTLVLVEHDPVITVGVQGAAGETFPPGVPVFHVERGGKSTFHGPGQLVGYPIVDLDPRGRDVRRFVRDVEQVVIEAVAEFGVRADRVMGRRGVWVDGERKIASVGIAIEQWVTFHGFALNVKTDLATFRSFRPCGFDGKVMTSLTQERGRTYEVVAAQLPVIRGWQHVFGGEVQETSTVPAPPASASASPA